MDRLSKAFLILATVGIFDAIYHAYGELTNYTSYLSNVCTINSFFSCSRVFQSGYATFPPGPYSVALWVYGVIWFPLMLVLGYLFVRRSSSISGLIMVPVLMVGNVFTFYLWYLELFTIRALCPVCISLYILNYIMTGLALVAMLRES